MHPRAVEEHKQKQRRAEREETRTVWASSWQEMVAHFLEAMAAGVSPAGGHKLAFGQKEGV